MKESESKLVLWFEIFKRLTKTCDILCGIVYIPPENSIYAQSIPYFETEELNVFRDKYQCVLLFGDYNSRTKLLKDYIDVDEELFSENHMEDDYNDLHGDMCIFDDENTNVTMIRNNSDNSTNNYGYQLIDFCKSQSLYILNVKMRGDSCGSFTCKNVSCVDYFICSVIFIICRLMNFVNFYRMHTHQLRYVFLLRTVPGRFKIGKYKARKDSLMWRQ